VNFNRTPIAFCSHDHPEKMKANIWYLMEHGLIAIDNNVNINRDIFSLLSNSRATKDGVDFMLQDGGLGAILNITTIKLHDDTLRLLSDFVNQNVEDSEDKRRFLQQIRELPYEATKHIALELVGKGLAQMPNAIHWLQTMLPHS
jgi:hypothetical protein